jgi:hypothetical protein
MIIDQAALIEDLGISEEDLLGLLAQGMPSAVSGGSRVFVETVSEVAKALAVHERTIYLWKKRGMPGSTGQYDLDEIRQWREEQVDVDATPVESERAKLLSIERRQRELKLQQALGEVAPVDQWFRRMTRRVNEAKAVLVQFPEMITAVVEEARCPAEVVRNVRRRADETVRQVCDMIADLSHPEDTEEASQDDEEADDL